MVFSGEDAAILDIEQWIDLMNVSISPWMFKELEQKYSPSGRPTRIGPKYSTAVIDKLFFDIDCLTEKGRFIQKSYDSMERLWDWATENNFKRDISFTGGGYQMCVGVKNLNTESYRNVIHYLIEELNLYIDENISLTDMRRYIGSKNYGKDGKSPRDRWCVSLHDWEVKKGWGYHLSISRECRVGQFKYGINYYDPPKVGTVRKRRELDRRTDFTINNELDEIFENYGWSYNDICPSMKNIIEQPRVGHHQRIYVIKYLKTIVGMSYGDTVLVMPKLLTSKHGSMNDGHHCLEEGQPYNVYSRNMYFSPDKMRENGYCDDSCTKCDELIHIMLQSRKDIGIETIGVKKVKVPKLWGGK